MRRNIVLMLMCAALLSLTSCAFLPGRSNAFEAGFRIGEKYALAQEGCQLFGSELENQETGGQSASCSLEPAEIEKYCTGIWLATAFLEALENSERNRQDFIASCLKGSGI